MDTLHEETYKGYYIEINYDPYDPRNDQDNITTMICFHNRYNLGDSHNYDHNDYSGWDEMSKAILRNEDVAVIAPLYLYDHSGITINTTGFSCPWDSGQIGFIIIRKKDAREWMGWKRITDKRKQILKERLISDTNEYDYFLTGMQYRYDIYEKDEWQDSQGPYYDDDEALKDAKKVIDHWKKKS